ncbi:redoxin domain-containing protein [Mucilaginibacter sp. 21P]|uniref:redoxin domain-containing protein n=1 Tax=Mucilaginibacter sp. 21P TaxID=2778902 RepID=UPI001C58C620|nr:redoxin domain-containing protein [Mucilaginibacter sp. 21P]QXV64495.1 redoxin domain-containing protein [Mucilaginibacter sp. 21P]
MKTLNLLLAVPGMLFIHNSFAQSSKHLTLSDETPSVGETINLSYNPAGTSLDGKSDIKAAVYFLDNKKFPVADVDLKKKGNDLTGNFTVPSDAKALFVKLSSGTDVDDNGENGYVYMVYDKANKPVQGANAMKAYLLGSGMGGYFAKIKNNQAAAKELYKQEFTLYPQSQKDFGAAYWGMVGTSKDNADKAAYIAKMLELSKSNLETDMTLAYNLLQRTRKTKEADSLGNIIVAKFPNGDVAKTKAGMAVYNERDPAKKEELYKAYIAKYPESNDENTVQDNFRLQIASAYLAAGNVAKYDKWATEVKNKSQLAGALNNTAWNWVEKGERLEEAASLSKQSLDILDDLYKNDKAPSMYTSPAQARENNRETYNMYADTYAFILYKQGKFKEALKYQQAVYDARKTEDAEINEHYALILNANGQYAKAKEVIEKSMIAGKTNVALKEQLAVAYKKVKGSDSGYQEYLAGLEKQKMMKAKAKFIKDMINTPAPAFALKDFDGKEVSLASLKGKVVVVDFWATWCGPCKASFPGMQMAVNKYKDNENVKFLFIDTWETGDNYQLNVQKFIADNKYTFHVLMDEKGEDGRQSKVVSQFKVEGIPTKFIIDKNGNIRFKYVGYSGSSDAVLDEVTNMVDLAADPEAVSNASKVTMLK